MPRSRSARTVAMMSSVASARCWTPGPPIEVEILVDLRLLLALRRLVDRELDPLVAVRHHLRHERRVLRRDVLVVERDEILEAHHVLVELDPDVHLPELDVADAVVDVQQSGRLRLIARLALLEAGQERAAIVPALDERMDRVAVDLDAGDDRLRRRRRASCAARTPTRRRARPLWRTRRARRRPRARCRARRRRARARGRRCRRRAPSGDVSTRRILFCTSR